MIFPLLNSYPALKMALVNLEASQKVGGSLPISLATKIIFFGYKRDKIARLFSPTHTIFVFGSTFSKSIPRSFLIERAIPV